MAVYADELEIYKELSPLVIKGDNTLYGTNIGIGHGDEFLYRRMCMETNLYGTNCLGTNCLGTNRHRFPKSMSIRLIAQPPLEVSTLTPLLSPDDFAISFHWQKSHQITIQLKKLKSQINFSTTRLLA